VEKAETLVRKKGSYETVLWDITPLNSDESTWLVIDVAYLNSSLTWG
jgi:hypothetical protein